MWWCQSQHETVGIANGGEGVCYDGSSGGGEGRGMLVDANMGIRHVGY